MQATRLGLLQATRSTFFASEQRAWLAPPPPRANRLFHGSASSSSPMLSDAQEVKELQALGIGETTARHREARAPAVDENAHKAMEEAQDVARKADFSDLRGSADGGLFTIDKTEERGLLLEQLRKVYAHIERRRRAVSSVD